MRRFISLALASASAAAIASTAAAQTPSAALAAAPADQATLGEIVVTARRRSESLQEVPQTVNAVTSDTLQKLNIRQFQDVQTVVPGLSLASSTSGFAAAASLRGVTFDVTTGAQPTVALYLNDAPVQALFLFQSLFDVGQVEVLKGPQGTTRGISAPSGAITVTTHKPDLSSFGGFADVTLNDLQGRIAQGAINVPIVKDVLALRAAASIDQNDYDGVRSIHSNLRPSQKTSAERFALSFEPSDVFNANVTYQHMDHNYLSFPQAAGPGPGAVVYPPGTTPPSFPASYNPPISPEDRLSVDDAPSKIRQHFDVVTAQVDSRILGQHLSYVGSYQHQRLGINSANDNGDLIPFGDVINAQTTTQVQTTQEIRLASDPAPGRFFDYTVGAFYNWQENAGHVTQTATFLPGAFGLSPGVNFAAFNQNYRVPVLIDIPSTLQETSLFGSVTLHLGAKTELSGGIRHIWSISNSATVINVGNGLLNLGAIGLPTTLPCSILGGTAGPAPGDCFLHTAQNAGNFTSRASETPNIYNVSLSHHVTRDFLVYANTGTSFRPPVTSIGLTGAIVSSPLPVLHNLTFHPSERSRAYEVGFKSTWLDGRARLNASLFRQRFTNFTMFLPGINFFSTTTNAATTSFGMTASVDARVQGFDVDTAFQVTPEWNISAQMSYADGKVQGSQVPCNTFAADGVTPTFNTVDPASGVAVVSLCPGRSASRLPLWNATFTSEYVHPVFDDTDGFFRILATYYPENKNRVEPNFTVPNYSLVNFYLGVRSHDGAWEASIFARNAFKAERTLDLAQTQYNLNGPLGQVFARLIHPSGYFQTQVTPRREVGINVHYAFGSR
jgi:iron complex outermembrane receptor protein